MINCYYDQDLYICCHCGCEYYWIHSENPDFEFNNPIEQGGLCISCYDAKLNEESKEEKAHTNLFELTPFININCKIINSLLDQFDHYFHSPLHTLINEEIFTRMFKSWLFLI